MPCGWAAYFFRAVCGLLPDTHPSRNSGARGVHVRGIFTTSRRIGFAFMLVSVLGGMRGAVAADLTAMTFNTKHGGEAPWHTADQIAEIVAEHLHLVLLQETDV